MKLIFWQFRKLTKFYFDVQRNVKIQSEDNVKIYAAVIYFLESVMRAGNKLEFVSLKLSAELFDNLKTPLAGIKI